MKRTPTRLLYSHKDYSHILHRFIILSSVSLLLVFFAIWIKICEIRPLWNDELFTFYISRLSTLEGITDALSTGGEQIPIIYYVLQSNLVWFFGDSPIIIRILSILGFVIAGTSIFFFLMRRIPRSHALIAAILLFAVAHPFRIYAYEARPYGLVLGFSALALFCWQSTSTASGKWLSRAGLFLAIALALGCHYFAILMIVPLAAGEAVRVVRGEKINIGTWAALIFPAVVVFALSFNVVAAASANKGSFWSKEPHLKVIYTVYHDSIAQQLSTACVGILAAMINFVLSTRRQPVRRGDFSFKITFPLPMEERVAVLGMAAIPILGAGVVIWTGASVSRYYISTLTGTTIIIGLLLSVLLTRFLLSSKVILSVLLIALLAASLSDLRAARSQADALQSTITALQTYAQPALPIVTLETHAALELTHYAPPDIRTRLQYLVSIPSSERYLGHSSVERGILVLVGPFFGVAVSEYESFLRNNCSFFLFGSLDPSSTWIQPKLREDGWSISLVYHNLGRSQFLFKATDSTRSCR